MNDTFQQSVYEFRRSFNLPVVAPKTYEELTRNVALQHNLITSEAIEFLSALDKNDLVEQYDAVIDMLYVWYGMAISMGKPNLPLDDEWTRGSTGRQYGSYAEKKYVLYLPAIDVVYCATMPLSDSRGIGTASYMSYYYDNLDSIYSKISILIHKLDMSHELVHALFTEVHESNMSKLDENGAPIYNEIGKVIKSDRYRQPDINKVLLSIASMKG